MITRICRELVVGDESGVNSDAARSDARIFRKPRRIRFLVFLLKIGYRRIIEKVRWMFFIGQWGVGTVRMPVSALIEAEERPNVEWIPQKKNHDFIADPMAVKWKGKLVLLAEEFVGSESKGRIVQLDDRYPTGQREVAINLPHHLSYPYLLEYDDKLFCIPESGTAKNVCAHLYNESLNEWEHYAVLMDNVEEAYDATVFQHGEYWWLFYCERINSCIVKLRACYSDSPFGSWTEHQLNPLTTDIQSSRPGGPPFYHKNSLYRFGQNSGKRYGAAVSLCRIDELTPTSYVEKKLKTLAPSESGDYGKGFHTVVGIDEETTLVDGYRENFSFLKPFDVVPRAFKQKFSSS